MSTLSKIARTALEPVVPGAGTQLPDRIIRNTVTRPKYRWVVKLFFRGLLDPANYPPGAQFREIVLYVEKSTRFPYGMIRAWEIVYRELAGYETVTEVQVIPGAFIPAPAPKAIPVPSAWDATAWSIEDLRQPLEATWKVGAFTAAASGGGALVGLALSPLADGAALAGVAHGIRVENGTAYMHNAPQPGLPASAGGTVLTPAVDVAAGDELKITLIDGVVRFYADGVLMGTQPSYVGDHAVRLAAALYDARDTVEDPTFERLGLSGSGGARLQVVARGADYGYAEGSARLKVTARGGANRSFARLRLYAKGSARAPGGTAQLRVKAEGYGNRLGYGTGTATLGRVVALGGDYAFSFGGARLIVMASGTGGSPNAKLAGRAHASAEMICSTDPGPHGGLYARLAAASSFGATVASPQALAGAAAARAVFKASQVFLERMDATVAADAGLSAQRVVDVALVVGAGVEAQQLGILVISAALPAGVGVGAAIAGVRVTDARLDAELAVDGTWAASAVLNAALTAAVRAGMVVHMPGANLQVWAVQDATGGSTAYEQYPFNSFARINGRFYGAAEGGIFELVGDTDGVDEAPIDAYVNLGKQDFGSNVIKGISNAYLSVASPSQMAVRVTTPDGAQYTYTTRRADEGMRTQRVDFGRGLRAHYFGLEVMNEGGAEFDLESIEALVTEMKRRI